MPNTPAAEPRSHVEPALLVSIHDVSPLTLEASRGAVDLALRAGVGIDALTILVIPCHDGQAPLDAHRETVDWLRRLADGGACLCLHGWTHRMSGRPRNPWQWAWARGFARGQAELYLSDADDCRRRLDAALAAIDRAGLADAVHGFVPPAWLLSDAAHRVVRQAGFSFYEQLSGISVGDAMLARRLIGFGSLSAIEACATAAHAWLQSQRRPVDTRLAIHPADVARSSISRTVQRTIRRMVPQMTAMNYMTFLRTRCIGALAATAAPALAPAAT